MEFYIHTDIKEQFLERSRLRVPPEIEGQKNVEREIVFWRSAGYDYVPIELSLRYHPKRFRGTIQQVARENLFLDYTRKSASRGWVERVKGLISSVDDVDRFPWPDADQVDFSPLERIASVLPAGMRVIAQPGRMFQAVWALMGFEEFCVALFDDYPLVERLFEKCCSLQLDVIERTLSHDCVGGVWVGDDLAFSGGLMIRKEHFVKLLFPWISRVGELCRKRDRLFLYHSDGDIRELVDDFIDSGVHALHPIEPQIMDIGAVKAAINGKMAVVGNIDLDFPLTRGTPIDVRHGVRKTIEAVATGGGFCIGSANSIPSYIPFENYMALREESLSAGAYPVSKTYR